MSLSGVNPDIDDAPGPARPDPDPGSGAGRRWPVPELPRLSPGLTGTLIYAGIRLLSAAITAFLLGHGHYQLRHWSLIRWARSSDGGHYIYDAACGAIVDPAGVEAALKSITGVVEHGLFLGLAECALIGTDEGVVWVER